MVADQQEEEQTTRDGVAALPAEPKRRRLVMRGFSVLMVLAALVTGIVAEIHITQVNITYTYV